MDLSKIGKTAAENDSVQRKIVKGRVLQYDADFACYEVSDLEEPVTKSFQRLLDHIEMKRAMVGAERVNAFITLGEKSGREDMATVKEYQENRDPDKPIKVRVRELRHMLANFEATPTITPVIGLNYEADDLMCMYQSANLDNSILMSGDKDLWMVQGQHADVRTGRTWLVEGYESTRYKEVGNVKPKLVGTGYSWFWHQMIMGDTADNIPGLPKIHNSLLDVYTPLKSGKPRKDGLAQCGEAKAVAMLLNARDCKTAAKRVYDAYWRTYGGEAMERFIEQAYLLWMQRDDNPWDVLYYMRDNAGLKLSPSLRQIAVIGEFKERKLTRQRLKES
ncbi:MAG: putative ribonuclease H [Prokaryotic dsDNA virus sp.]|nr:MAG: putative ribonuclease H [Prokaryotic dsDNA virus sp.]|tara:strand:- start:18313 stop:19314 length:1002 start_codon:yes stop_codon:yes gene_type:complete